MNILWIIYAHSITIVGRTQLNLYFLLRGFAAFSKVIKNLYTTILESVHNILLNATKLFKVKDFVKYKSNKMTEPINCPYSL